MQDAIGVATNILRSKRIFVLLPSVRLQFSGRWSRFTFRRTQRRYDLLLRASYPQHPDRWPIPIDTTFERQSTHTEIHLSHGDMHQHTGRRAAKLAIPGFHKSIIYPSHHYTLHSFPTAHDHHFSWTTLTTSLEAIQQVGARTRTSGECMTAADRRVGFAV